MNRETQAQRESPERGRVLLPLLLLLLCALPALCLISIPGTSVPRLPAAELPQIELTGAEPGAAPEPELRFSHPSGIYDVDALTVRISAPEGYTIACTTDGRAPTPEDDCGAARVQVRLESRGEETLLEHADLLLCPLDTPMRADPELPRGRVLRAALLDPLGKLTASETREIGRAHV